MLRPRLALMLNVVGVPYFIGLWIAFRGVKGLGFDSDTALLAAIDCHRAVELPGTCQRTEGEPEWPTLSSKRHR